MPHKRNAGTGVGKAKRTALRLRGRHRQAARYWSEKVTRESHALDLERSVFTRPSARGIALSLKRSAESSLRRKAGPYQSAMSMLNLYINRAGRNLPARRKRILAKAKAELRRLYRRDRTDGPR